MQQWIQKLSLDISQYLHGLQVTWPFLHCMIGGRDILAHTGHSRFAFKSSGSTRFESSPSLKGRVSMVSRRSDLALGARHVAASLPVYHQVCNLENVVLNLLVETENTNLLPSLLSMMALNSTALTSRG